MKALNRTHVKVDDNTYRLYPENSPFFYKKPDGTFDDIDLTFNDTTSTIGDISLMDKGIASVGKRKGNNPNKIVGVRPDTNQHLGTQQLEFSLVSVDLDGELQNFNVEDDLEIKLQNSQINQLVKLNKSFRNCKIEFDIHTKGIELQNTKYTSTNKIADYGFNLTNIGENNGSSIFDIHTAYNPLNKTIPYFDCYIGKITDNYITTGQYSLEEEFGDSDLTNYIINTDMYPNGSSVYYKDSIVFTIHSYNIENYEDIVINNLCDMYELEVFDDGGSGKYLTKNNKKVIGYYWENNVFYGFINTIDISDEIKTLFKRKTFEDTSFLNISLTDFCNDIANRFDIDLSISVDNNYYKPINDEFDFKISEKSYYICNPIAFDNDYNMLNYYTTHTLTDNEDGSYRYTKYLKPETSLNVNVAKYLDANLALNQSGSGRFKHELRVVPSSSNLTTMRNAASTSIHASNISSTIGTVDLCGDIRGKSISTPLNGSPTTVNKYNIIQSHFIFDTSGISSAVTSASFKQRGRVYDQRNIGTGSGTASNTDISVIALKSTWDGTTAKVSSVYPQWNDFTGFTADWDDTDVNEYSAETVWAYETDLTVVQQLDTTLNSSAKTDMQNDSTFKLVMIDYDQYYLNSYDSSYSIPSTSGNGFHSHSRVAKTYTFNYSLDTSLKPYIEYSDGSVSTPTDNATFFGANF